MSRWRRSAVGNVAEGVVPFELLDEQLDTRAVVAETPEIQRVQRQIGDQDLIMGAAQFEEGPALFETVPPSPDARYQGGDGHHCGCHHHDRPESDKERRQCSGPRDASNHQGQAVVFRYVGVYRR